ncbi:hypothetical protein [Rhizobium multihospitium]|nr:hypothetical protein [Rhizobium multihospitium]
MRNGAWAIGTPSSADMAAGDRGKIRNPIRLRVVIMGSSRHGA